MTRRIYSRFGPEVLSNVKNAQAGTTMRAGYEQPQYLFFDRNNRRFSTLQLQGKRYMVSNLQPCQLIFSH